MNWSIQILVFVADGAPGCAPETLRAAIDDRLSATDRSRGARDAPGACGGNAGGG
ncbi:MAG: hypothetical protein II839_13495 [Kiritimatiellae bacterium]|nr:hypothetical protein [Kiritimatiellia bacterium]